MKILFILLLLYGCDWAENRSQQASKVIKDFTPSMTKEEAKEYNSKKEKNRSRERETQSNDSETPGVIVVTSSGDEACKDRYIKELESYNDCIEFCEITKPIYPADSDIYNKKCGGVLGQCGSPPFKPFCALGL